MDEGEDDIYVTYLDRGQKILLSVYVYPHLGQPPKQHFDLVTREIPKVHPQAKRVTEEDWKLKQGEGGADGKDAKNAKNAPREFAGRRAMFQFVMRSREDGELAVVSEAYLLRHGDFFIKFRVTFPADNQPAASDRIERFLGRLTLPESPRRKAVTRK